MRVKLTFAPNEPEKQILIPLDFRRYFISAIKSLTQGSNIFERFEKDKPGYSPYTFSVGFGKILNIDSRNQVMTVIPPVTMTISTGIYEVMTVLCNGAINKKGQRILGSLGLDLNNITLLPAKKIQASRQIFKIHSHAVLRGRDSYIAGSNRDELEEAINTHFMNHYYFLLSEWSGIYNSNVQPVKIDFSSTCLRKGVCSHYGGRLTTIQGKIGLFGTPESLQFLYDFGIGVRGGQGYGLLEVNYQS